MLHTYNLFYNTYTKVKCFNTVFVMTQCTNIELNRTPKEKTLSITITSFLYELEGAFYYLYSYYNIQKQEKSNALKLLFLNVVNIYIHIYYKIYFSISAGRRIATSDQPARVPYDDTSINIIQIYTGIIFLYCLPYVHLFH